MALFKKSLIALILVVPFLLGFGYTVQAHGTGIINSEPEGDNNGADIYHEIVGNERAYIHFSLPRYTSTGSFMVSYDTSSAHETKFYGSKDIYFDRNIWNPDVTNYSIFVVETLDEQGNYVVQYSSRDASHNYLNFQGTSEGIQISTIQEYEGTSLTTQEHVMYLFDGKTYRIYWEKSNVYRDIAISDLPESTGSPYKEGNYGVVSLAIDGSYLDVTIQMVHTYKLARMLVDDITAFENVQYAYYWTDNNNKFITMTYEEKEPVYLSSLPIQARPWTQTVTWNLTTNEIRSVNKVDVFAYHAKDSNRNIYTYMYMPNTIHDSLISVTAKISYRFEWYIGGKSDVRTDTVVLRAGDENKFSPTWEKKLLYYSIYSYFTYIDIGSKLLNFDNPLWTRSLDQINVVSNPTSELVEKITGAWNEAYDANVIIDTDSNKLYRLNWGQYDEWGARNVYLVEDTFQFSEIVFVQNGQVNLLTFDDIILKDVIDKTLEPSEPGYDFIKMVLDMIKTPEQAVILAVGIFIILAVILTIVFAPLMPILKVVVSVLGILLEGVARVFVALISRPWFWVLSLVGSIIYIIYINI